MPIARIRRQGGDLLPNMFANQALRAFRKGEFVCETGFEQLGTRGSTRVGVCAAALRKSTRETITNGSRFTWPRCRRGGAGLY
jgi:hypothetical protein